MRVNSIGAINFNNTQNQVRKVSKPISFGEEIDGWTQEDCQNYTNNGINKFFDRAKEFHKESKDDVKFIRGLAEKAYRAGEKINFARFSGETIKIKGVEYDIKCAKNGNEKTVAIENEFQKFKFHFDRDAKELPQSYNVECESGNIAYKDFVAKLYIRPKVTVCTKKEKYENAQIITFDNKGGYTYQEKSSFDSPDYKMAIVKSFPNASKSLYIENTRWLDGDTKRVYSRQPGSKDWIKQNEN